MDSLYCLVRIILNKKFSLYCLNLNCNLNVNKKDNILIYPTCFTSKSAYKTLYLLSLHNMSSFFSMQHISYVSIELYKAELTTTFNQMYIQN